MPVIEAPVLAAPPPRCAFVDEPLTHPPVRRGLRSSTLAIPRCEYWLLPAYLTAWLLLTTTLWGPALRSTIAPSVPAGPKPAARRCDPPRQPWEKEVVLWREFVLPWETPSGKPGY